MKNKAFEVVALVLIVASFVVYAARAGEQMQARTLYAIENGSGPVCE